MLFRSTSPAIAVLAVVVAVALQVPGTTRRLYDLGYPPDDAIYLLPPLFVVLVPRCLGRTPSEAMRERRLRLWEGRVTALDAWRLGWKRLVASAPAVAFPTVVVAAVASAAVEVVGTQAAAGIPAPGVDTSAMEQGLVAAIAFVGMYTLLQYAKRESATRASWWPSLFLLPLGLYYLALRFRGDKGQLGVILSGIPHDAANMVVAPVFAGLLVGLWVSAARPDADGRWPSASEAWEQAKEGMWGVGAVWGARMQWTWLGMQVLILGIWFAVSYAMADLLAVLAPDRPALRGSTELVRGHRSRIFKVLTIWFYLTVVVARTLVLLVFVDGSTIFNSLMVPSLLSSEAQGAVSFVSWLAGWWCALSLLTVLEDRASVLAARAAAEGGNAALAG